MNIEQAYDKYYSIIESRAAVWHKKTGIEYQEMRAEADYVFCECYHKYNHKKSCFLTYLWRGLDQHFMCLRNKYFEKQKKEQAFIELPAMFISENHIAKLRFEELIEELSDISKIILDAVFNPPQEYRSAYNRSIPICRKKIKQYLKSNGYMGITIDKGFKEIKDMLQEARA